MVLQAQLLAFFLRSIYESSRNTRVQIPKMRSASRILEIPRCDGIPAVTS